MTEEELQRFKSMTDHDLLITVATDVRHLKDTLAEIKSTTEIKSRDYYRDFATKTQLRSTNSAVKWLYGIVSGTFIGLILWITKT